MYVRLLILICIWRPSLTGQVTGNAEKFQNYYRHFTVEDGLPSNEAYFVYQDRDRYLWICTDNGVSRFDGTRLRSYTEQEGLCSNVIFGCTETVSGDLWFYSLTGELSRYDRERDRFECPPFNDSLAAILRGRIVQNLAFDKDTMFIATSDSYVKVHSGAEGITFSEHSPARGVLQARQFPGGKTIAIYNSEKNGTLTLEFHGTSRRQVVTGLRQAGKYSQRISSAFDSSLVVLFGENILRFDTASGLCSLEHLPFANTPGLGRSRTGLLSGSINNGLWRIVRKNDRSQVENVLSEISISCAIQDHLGGIWASSHTDGLYYIPTPAVFARLGKHHLNTEKARALLIVKDHAFYLTYDGKLYRVSLGEEVPRCRQLLDMSPSAPTVLPLNDHELALNAGEPQAVDYRTGAMRQLSRKEWQEASRSQVQTSRDTIYISTLKGRYYLADKWKYGRVTSRVSGNGGHTWLGTVFDLFIADSATKTLTAVGKSNGFHRLYVKQLIHIGGDTVIAATTQGIVFISGSRIFRVIASRNGLSSDKVFTLLKTGPYLWAGTSRGIDRIDLRSTGGFSVFSLSGSSGIPTCPTTHLGTLGKYLVAGTDQGLFLFDHRQLVDEKLTFKPAIVSVDHLPHVGDTVLHHSHSDNSIRLRFTAFNYRNSLSNLFRWRLRKNGNETWQVSDQNYVHFSSLQPGEYAFEVQVKTPRGTWSAEKAVLDVIIRPPFWKSGWFISLAIAFVVFAAWMLVRLRVRRMRQFSEIRGKLAEAKIQALGMQLNPHFVFNALNSVSYHISNNDAKVTLKYLGTFAKLMRIVFANSQKVLIPIEDEMKALRLYIELETVRLGKGFKYSLEVEEGVSETGHLIPSLLLQPIVENAIWHGIGPLSVDGEIQILVGMTGESLLIRVIDNGIGRAAAAKRKKKMQKEKHSLSIIGERLNLLGAHYNAEVGMEITDLRDADASGTVVTLRLPVLRVQQVKTLASHFSS